MIANLDKELAAALKASGQKALEVIDPDTQLHYVLVDRDTHQRAMAALHLQQDHAAIAAGIAQMEAGQGKPLDEAMANIRHRLDFASDT